MKETVFSTEMGEGRGNRVRGKDIITCSLFEFIFEKYLIKPNMYNRRPNWIESLLTINKDSLHVAFTQEKNWASKHTSSEELDFLRKLLSMVDRHHSAFQERPGHLLASHSQVCFQLVFDSYLWEPSIPPGFFI